MFIVLLCFACVCVAVFCLWFWSVFGTVVGVFCGGGGAVVSLGA